MRNRELRVISKFQFTAVLLCVKSYTVGFCRYLALRRSTTSPRAVDEYSQERLLEAVGGGALRRLVRPATGHDRVEAGWATGGEGQPLPVLQLPYHVVVLHAAERLHAQHQDLPHADACRR